MTDVFGSADDLLADRGAQEIPHPGGTLLDHLRRVRELLESWGADDDVALAGLCHAAYGTDGFAVALFSLDERPLLVEAIGGAAESVVYSYGRCGRSATYPTLGTGSPVFTDRFTGATHSPSGAELAAFLEITAANELDVFRHNVDLRARYYGSLRALLSRVTDHLSPGALNAWDIPLR